MAQTRFEFLKEVLDHLMRAGEMPISRQVCQVLLAQQAGRHPCLHGPYGRDEVIVMLAALAQYELLCTRQTALHADPAPQTSADAAVHFIALANRITAATGAGCWPQLMAVALFPFTLAWPRAYAC